MVRYIFSFCFLCSISTTILSQVNDSINRVGTRVAEEMPATIDEIRSFVEDNVKYPESREPDSISGSVIVTFWVDTLGTTYGHIVERSLGKEFDEEALRVCKLINFPKPAYSGGVPVQVFYTLPVTFTKQFKRSNGKR